MPKLRDACMIFAAALERRGIDPTDVTIVLKPRDMAALRAGVQHEFLGSGAQPSAEGSVEIAGLTFTPWREPARR